MQSEIIIEDLKNEYVPYALRISKIELGIDYQDENDFLECIDNKNLFCKIALYNGNVVGFSICKMFGPENVDEILKLPDSKDRDMMMRFNRIGLFDSISIDDCIKGHGIGKILAKECFKKMIDCGCDILCAMAWKCIDGTTNIKKILDDNGFTERISIQGYWNLMVDSPEGHHCPICGAPDKCFGVLYTKIV